VGYTTLRIEKVDHNAIVREVNEILRSFQEVELEFSKTPAPNVFRDLLLNLQKDLPRDRWFLSLKDSVISGVLFNLNFSRPRRAVIEISNGCNLKCDFCWTHSPLLKNPPDSKWLKRVIDPATVYKYLDDLADLGTVDLIEFCAIGDPLYHPQVWEFIAFAKSKNLRVRLSTNATLLYPRKWEEYGSGTVSELFMNISAGDRDTYAAIHNVAPVVFDRLIENLQYIHEQRKNSGNPVYMSWINIITDKNIGNIDAIIESGLRVGADFFDFRPVWVHKEFQKNIGVSSEALAKYGDSLSSVEERINRNKLASNFSEFKKIIEEIRNVQ
jgi:wyosine [tRNA(Phe)-imidazoG37] synthetase (radical SAM superfamily)